MNVVAQDRPDAQVAVSHLCSHTSKPTQRSWTMLKRTGRYLKHRQRVQYELEEQNGERGTELIVYSDSDWARCRTTRKSRSGGMILMSGGLIQSWSNRQGSVALSSGEAEYYAVLKASADVLGAQALARESLCSIERLVQGGPMLWASVAILAQA